jgi:hypothetical protein
MPPEHEHREARDDRGPDAVEDDRCAHRTRDERMAGGSGLVLAGGCDAGSPKIVSSTPSAVVIRLIARRPSSSYQISP